MTEEKSPYAYTLPILIVEDAPLNHVIAEAMVTRMGLRSEWAKDGKEASQLFQTGKYSLVLMDCQMPVMDGYEATKRIRTLEAGKSRVAIVALTSLSLDSDREKCLQSGMDDMLSKPVRYEDFARKIKSWLKTTGQIAG